MNSRIAPGLGIVDQQIGDLADREVDLVADRDQPREADAARIGARQQGADQAAALAHQPPVAGAQLVDGEGGIGGQRHRRIGADRADAVGPDQPDAGLAARCAPARPAARRRRRRHRRSRRPGSTPPSRRACRTPPAPRPHPCRSAGCRRGRCRPAIASIVLVGLVAEDLGARRIDRQDLAREAVLAAGSAAAARSSWFRRPKRRSGRCVSARTSREQHVEEAHGASILGACSPAARFIAASAAVALPALPAQAPGLAQQADQARRALCARRHDRRRRPHGRPNISASGSARTSSSTTSRARARSSARRRSPRPRPTATRC